ncbi:hypothetical protein ACFL2H_01545, partial [Planctomycetota bacterium]
MSITSRPTYDQAPSAKRRKNEGHSGHELGFCNLPPVPERTFGEDVSPHRARLLAYIAKKWVNGTKLRYYFFE